MTVMLSPTDFAELVTVIQTTRDGGSRSEVRRANRLAHECNITISLPPDERPESQQVVHVKDISARGMSFLHHEALPDGTQFLVRLEGTNGATVSILASAVYSRQIDASSWRIGTEFTCVHNPEQEPTFEKSPEDQMQIRRSILD